MNHIIYDLTYAARGKSGIPRDTRSVAEILGDSAQNEVQFVISATNPSFKGNVFGKKQLSNDSEFLKRTIHPPKSSMFRVGALRTLIGTLNFRRKIKVEKVTTNQASQLLSQLGINGIKSGKISRISVMQVWYPSRFTRLKFLPPHCLNTDGFNFFIQQHVDPISVSPQTIHIVRLHDILPITHPFYFSKKARWAFSRGLNTLLKDPKIIWVTDTLATKKEFVDFYGRHLKVEVIPCEVGFGFKLEHIYESINKKHKESSDGKNIFLCVNTIEPRKNVEIVVQAFLCAQEKVPKNRKDQLIIVGKYGWLEEVLISKLRTNFFGPNIIFIEDIDDRELQEWYEKANFLVSASAAEGFGLPPLEGMLFGCIPIVSSLEQHRETIEEYGIFFDIDKKLLSEALIKAKSMSSEEKAAMGFKVHDYVKNKYSRESLKTRWEELLVRLQMEPT